MDNMRTVTPSQVMAETIIAQACCMADIFEANGDDIAVLAWRVKQMDQMRHQMAEHVPTLRSLDGWTKRLCSVD